SLFLVAPIFSAKTIPALVRMGFAVPIAVAVFMGAGSPVFVGWDRTATLIPAVVMEVLMGVGAGLAARFAIEAALGAGSAIAIAAGVSFGSVIDPLHGAESTAIGDLLSYLTMAVALSTGLHRDAVVWLCRSVQETPPGSDFSVATLATRVVADGAASIALSVRLAFPVLAAVTLGHLGLGLVNRAAPQFNLSNIGFTVALLAGCGAFYLVAPGAAVLAAEAARTVFARR
ncbi:MAG TPA: flagellar biosynthetic protein FliR, partial [Polyangia bacterium]